MRKILPAIIAFMLLFTSCSGSLPDGETDTSPDMTTESETAAELETTAETETETTEETMRADTFTLVSEELPTANADMTTASDSDSGTYFTLEDNELVLILDEPTAFNRVELCEKVTAKGGNSRAFHIDAWNGESWVKIYANDLIDKYRLCAVDEITCRAVHLVIDESSGKNVKISEMSVYLAEKTDTSDFRVMAYVHPNGYIYNTLDVKETAAQSEIVTDIIFNGFLHWNEDGNGGLSLEYNSSFKGYYKQFTKYFNTQRTHLGLNNHCDLVNDEEILTALADEACSAALEYGFNGISIDYEYPYTTAAYKAFNSFLVLLGERLHANGMELSVAVGLWNNHLDAAAIEAVDMFNLMSYDDQTDFESWHSTFRFAADELENAVAAGFPIERVNLGVPFYGEGTKVENGIYKIDWDRSTSYAHIYESLGGSFSPDINFYDGYYYNGATMIRDKTALAVEKGCLGVMIWALNHDIPCAEKYSLLKAIDEMK